MSEGHMLDALRLRLSRAGSRVFRNNTAVGWVGKLLGSRSAEGIVKIERARPLHAGLCVGSSDLIGWHPYTVRAEDVGKRIAVFTALEAKTATVRLSDEQRAFLAVVRDCGGIAIEARDVDETVRQVVEWRP